MKTDQLNTTPVALGRASRATLGGKGNLSDFVREIPATGISAD